MLKVTQKVPNILVLVLNKVISLFLTALVIQFLLSFVLPGLKLSLMDIILVRFIIQLAMGKGVEFSFVTKG